MIEAKKENCVTVHIWFAGNFWGGMLRHLTGRQRYSIGHTAIQTYDHPNPEDLEQIECGIFANYLPDPELVSILGQALGKTPHHEASLQYRDDPQRFLALDPPSVSIHLFDINPRMVEHMYLAFQERRESFKWSVFNPLHLVTFFYPSLGNGMSSTKLVLSLLQAGASNVTLPTDLEVPFLGEVSRLWERLCSVLLEGEEVQINVNFRSSDLSLQRLVKLLKDSGATVQGILTDIQEVVTYVAAITSKEIYDYASFLHEREKTLGIDYSMCPEKLKNSNEDEISLVTN